MTRMDPRKLIVLGALLLALVVFFALGWERYFTLDYLAQQQGALSDYYHRYPLRALAIYFAIYVLMAALSLPGAAVMTLVAGAIFGLGVGTLVVSFASTLGATLAMLVARFLLRDWVRRRFGEKLARIDRGVEHEGVFYLFTLRLIPVFPFFLVNLLMGLTPMKTWHFFLVSQIGMLPGTLVYVNAGQQLAAIRSPEDVLSPGLWLAFVLLGLFPLLAKKIVDHLAARRALRHWPRPRRFDYNLVVIGGGSAGLVSAYIAAAVKAKVALIEKQHMGGDCLNTGCVPSKALLRTTRLLGDAARARDFGLNRCQASFDFAAVMERVQQVVARVAPHDSPERYRSLGVDVIEGEARIVDPYRVEVNGRQLSARNIIVATGARPAVPALQGLEHIDYLTSDNLWSLRQQPRRLLVLGGGPIGCELAQAFARLGSRVTLVQRGARLLPREDEEVSALLHARFEQEGIEVLTGHEARRFERGEQGDVLVCAHADGERRIAFDRVLLALGRRANVRGFGLEDLGVVLRDDGTVAADPFLRTNFPNIFVCGDVTGPYQFTHVAAHQAWYAAVNALFSPWKRFRVDYRVIPWATYTDPEVARVGLNEQEARARGIAFEVTRFELGELDRAITDGETQGLVKVLTVPGKDSILGVTIVGHHASEMIAEFVTAMKYKLGLNKILGTIHIYPTFAEANKYVAGQWKRQHAPRRLLAWVARFHRWRRGA